MFKKSISLKLALKTQITPNTPFKKIKQTGTAILLVYALRQPSYRFESYRPSRYGGCSSIGQNTIKTKNLSRNCKLYGVIEVAPLELRDSCHIQLGSYIQGQAWYYGIGENGVMDNQCDGELVVQRDKNERLI